MKSLFSCDLFRDICLKFSKKLLDPHIWVIISIYVSAPRVFQHVESISAFRNEFWTTKNSDFVQILIIGFRRKNPFRRTIRQHLWKCIQSKVPFYSLSKESRDYSNRLVVFSSNLTLVWAMSINKNNFCFKHFSL